MAYTIATLEGNQANPAVLADITAFGPVFSVEAYNWGGEYRPQTTGRLLFLPDRGFLLQMRCRESNPVTRYVKDNDPVYTDSCLEGFIAFYPESERPGYVNFEINANGAMLSQYGTHRHDRRFLLDMGIQPPAPKAVRDPESWGFDLMISLDFIQTVYGRKDFKPGQILKGNFFKVGENDKQLHFASYAPILTEKPDFHQPDYFTELVLCNI